MTSPTTGPAPVAGDLAELINAFKEVVNTALTSTATTSLPTRTNSSSTSDNLDKTMKEEGRFRTEIREGKDGFRMSHTHIPNSQRYSLKTSELDKLRNNATRGLEDKFSLMSVSGNLVDAIELLEENVNATTLIAQVQHHCKKYGMDQVFDIVKPTDDDNCEIVKVATKGFFENYSTISREEILASVKHYRDYGQDYDIQNLEWSKDFLSNCCDKVLKAKMNERMTNKNKEEEISGPKKIFFYEMMEAILSLTADAATLMKEKLKTLMMQDFAGENVNKATTLLRGTIKRLEMINDVPSDITKQLINIFMTGSVPQFKQHFETLYSLNSISTIPGAGGIKYTSEQILQLAQSSYIQFSTIWNVPENIKTSTFITQGDKNVTC